MKLMPFKNESLLNFATEEARKKMMGALESVRRDFGKVYSLHTAESLSNSSRPVIKSVNPANPSQIIGSVESADLADAETALKTVTEGSKTWRRTPAEKRIQLTMDLAKWMEDRRYELAAWMVYEVGKNWREADADVCEAIDFCRYYAQEMNRLSEPRQTQVVSGENDHLHYFPRGVSLVIAPWNFPLAILTGMTVASLVTGNTVIIKPAEQSSVIGAKLAQGLLEVGFPRDSFYFLPGEGEKIGPFLVNDPRVDMIVFTGSAEVGLSIIESAARKPKPGQRGVKKVIAEMGGKNALIIDEDADLDEAVVASVHSAFGFQGQKCSALSRLLVHEKVYDVFVKRFIEATRSLRIGDPALPEFQVGPVVDEEAQKRILGTIKDAKSRLKTLYEASLETKAGYYVPPSVFEVTDAQEKWFQNEIFGPVVMVKKFSNLEEAVRDANSVHYALTGGIFSRSPSHIDYVKREMEVGNLYINRAITGAIVERHPFGGFKLSGIGSKAGGPDYLLQFLEPRTTSENTVRRGFAAETK
jgi:RHH-type proline utilization regulon transcriptional repressor/proline dehydrogenase/delta 1-pyrroline-5-carboxylate dehydrogenase